MTGGSRSSHHGNGESGNKRGNSQCFTNNKVIKTPKVGDFGKERMLKCVLHAQLIKKKFQGRGVREITEFAGRSDVFF